MSSVVQGVLWKRTVYGISFENKWLLVRCLKMPFGLPGPNEMEKEICISHYKKYNKILKLKSKLVKAI